MKDAFAQIWSAAASLLGAAVFLAIVWWIAKTHSRMWRLVSARYRLRHQAPVIARTMQTVVVTKRGAISPFRRNTGYCQYAGTIVAVTERGLRLSLIPMPPLNILAPALFLPFEEMALGRTSWMLWPEAFALRMTDLPEIDIILDRETVHWIRSRTSKAPFGSTN